MAVSENILTTRKVYDSKTRMELEVEMTIWHAIKLDLYRAIVASMRKR